MKDRANKFVYDDGSSGGLTIERLDGTVELVAPAHHGDKFASDGQGCYIIRGDTGEEEPAAPPPDEEGLTSLPADWCTVTIPPTIDPAKPGLYEWRIERAGSYIGQYGRIRRPTKEYSRNVVRLLNGKPYRKGKPDGFRRIHRELEKAHREGRRIDLIILENAEKPDINGRERELIRERGSLNDPPFGVKEPK